MAVINRDREQLEYLIRKGEDINDTEAAPYSPLCFSVNWPAEMEILLDANADRSSAIHCAIAYEDEVAVKMLLDRGTHLFAPSMVSTIDSFWERGAHHGSILSYALWYNRQRSSFNSKIIPLIVDALTRSRRNLMECARDNVSISKLKQLGWKDTNDSTTLLDSAAEPVFCFLKDKKVPIPEFLWPGSNTTVYHDPWMTPDAAELMLLAGFKELDLPDPEGATPLLLNCHCVQSADEFYTHLPKCLSWFLRHGAEQVVFPPLHGINTIQKLAAEVGYLWIDYYANESGVEQTKLVLTDFLELIDHLPPSIYTQRDDCDCFCSVGGCTAIQTLFKSVDEGWWPRINSPKLYTKWKDRTRLLQLWDSCFPSSHERISRYREACRFEIFSRLGIRHVCCKLRGTPYLSEDKYIGHDIPNLDDKTNLQGEDQYLKIQLDALMQVYGTLEKQFDAYFDKFWDIWWEVLEEFIPPEIWSKHYNVAGWGWKTVRHEAEELPIYEDELDSVLESIKQQVLEGMLLFLDQEVGCD